MTPRKPNESEVKALSKFNSLCDLPRMKLLFKRIVEKMPDLTPDEAQDIRLLELFLDDIVL